MQNYNRIQCIYTAFVSTSVAVNMFYLNMVLDSTRIRNTQTSCLKGKGTPKPRQMTD